MSFPKEQDQSSDQNPTTTPSEADSATPSTNRSDEVATTPEAGAHPATVEAKTEPADTAPADASTTSSSEAVSHTATPDMAVQYETLDTEAATRSHVWIGYVIAVVVVVLIILGVLYQLEAQGRSSTNFFEGVLSSQESRTVVATVNGEPISQRALEQSITQFGEAAQAQGVDPTNPEAQAQLRNQALTVLINTELLRQAAVERGISISDEAATEQFNTIQADIGGPEQLAERLVVLGLSEDELRAQIRDELLIQELLDALFLEAEVAVTDEEVQATYDEAAAAGNELPPLEEVRPAIEQQLIAQKEQAVIDEFIAEQREAATIEQRQ